MIPNGWGGPHPPGGFWFDTLQPKKSRMTGRALPQVPRWGKNSGASGGKQDVTLPPLPSLAGGPTPLGILGRASEDTIRHFRRVRLRRSYLWMWTMGDRNYKNCEHDSLNPDRCFGRDGGGGCVEPHLRRQKAGYYQTC